VPGLWMFFWRCSRAACASCAPRDPPVSAPQRGNRFRLCAARARRGERARGLPAAIAMGLMKGLPAPAARQLGNACGAGLYHGGCGMTARG
jgi:hypothetical protein